MGCCGQSGRDCLCVESGVSGTARGLQVKATSLAACKCARLQPLWRLLVGTLCLQDPFRWQGPMARFAGRTMACVDVSMQASCLSQRIAPWLGQALNAL